MLAYVFTHHAEAGTDLNEYEAELRRFHAALAAAPPSGFVFSSTFMTGDAYADWYLLESAAALDSLNFAAVSGERTGYHDALARMSKDGSGKLLTLVRGSPAKDAGFEMRFSKPPGMSYVDLDRMLDEWTGASLVSVWRRMMVLGPAPEFCLLSPKQIELPSSVGPEFLTRSPI